MFAPVDFSAARNVGVDISGSEEIQKRKVAGFLFGYMGAGKQ
jgi:hypothetical protein